MQSSTGAGLSLRIQGYLVTAIPTIVFISQLFGHPLVQADLSTVGDSITLIIGSVWAIFGAIMVIAGWARRNFMKANSLGAYAKK